MGVIPIEVSAIWINANTIVNENAKCERALIQLVRIVYGKKPQIFINGCNSQADGISAPVHGQLVPMAIPLGAPRQQGSVPPPQYIPTTPQIGQSQIITSTPLTGPTPGGAKTGLVTFKDIDDKEKRLIMQVCDYLSQST